MKTVLTFLLNMLTILISGAVLVAQDDATGPSRKRDARAGEMKRIVESLAISQGEESQKRTVKLAR